MASSTQQTVKKEPSGSSEQSTTTNTTIKPELDIVKIEEETFEQFYSEVIYFLNRNYFEMISFRLKRLKNVIQC